MTTHTDDLVFELPDPAYEAYSWVHEDLHQPTAQPGRRAGAGVAALRRESASCAASLQMPLDRA